MFPTNNYMKHEAQYKQPAEAQAIYYRPKPPKYETLIIPDMRGSQSMAI